MACRRGMQAWYVLYTADSLAVAGSTGISCHLPSQQAQESVPLIIEGSDVVDALMRPRFQQVGEFQLPEAVGLCLRVPHVATRGWSTEK